MEKPGYYSIIPSHVRYDEDLKPMEIIMYGELTALANFHGYSYATNNYFAELYKVHKNTVSTWINTLKNKGYIRVEVIRNENKEIVQRKIYINTPYQQKDLEGYQQKDLDPINKKIEGNSTRTNTTSINTISAFDNAQDTSLIENQFEEWWNLYNKKLDKKTALTKFKTVRKKYEFETIMNGTKAYLKTITDKQYQKHPKTFLNNKSFNNDYSEYYNTKGNNDKSGKESDNNWIDEMLGGI